MNRVKSYVKIAFKNILRNKAYSLFMILGISLTFAFIIIVLQVSDAIIKTQSPKSNSERIVNVQMQSINDKLTGKPCSPNPRNPDEINRIVKEYEYMTRKHNETAELFINNSMQLSTVAFIDNDYWNIYDYNFIDGRPFTEDYSYPVAVVKESFAKKSYGNGDAIGKEIEFQGNTYKVVGVVADFSFLIGEEASVWVPFKYNKFIPSNILDADLIYMFANDMQPLTMKTNVSRGILTYFEQTMEENRKSRESLPPGAYMGVYVVDPDLAPDKLYTEKELTAKRYGGEWFLFGVTLVVIVLMVVPMISIVMLSRANMSNRISETALHRAIGASKAETFGMIITENVILVMLSVATGWLAAYPMLYVIEQTFLNTAFSDGVALLGDMKISILFTLVLPLAAIFCLLSGGIPAWQMSRYNIYQSLKGGSK